MSDGAVWLVILGSLVMALASACVFIVSVRHKLFDDLEDSKYQIFWSDRDDPFSRSLEEDSAHASNRRS